MRPSYASICSVSNFFFSGNLTNFPAALQPSSTCQWFRLLTVCFERFTNQPIVFCVVRPTLNSLALAKRAVSLFSSRAAALVSRVSRLRRSRARALLSLNLKKKRDCSQSIRKPAFASVHTKTLSARFQNIPLWGPFSKTWVFMPENTVQWWAEG